MFDDDQIPDGDMTPSQAVITVLLYAAAAALMLATLVAAGGFVFEVLKGL